MLFAESDRQNDDIEVLLVAAALWGGGSAFLQVTFAYPFDFTLQLIDLEVTKVPPLV